LFEYHINAGYNKATQLSSLQTVTSRWMQELESATSATYSYISKLCKIQTSGINKQCYTKLFGIG
jgi:hypothetical protein